MNDILTAANDHPWLFVAALVLTWLLYSSVEYMYRLALFVAIISLHRKSNHPK